MLDRRDGIDVDQYIDEIRFIEKYRPFWVGYKHAPRVVGNSETSRSVLSSLLCRLSRDQK
jgi:hypothetical protein